MNTSTVLLILLSVLIASGLSYFQYFYKAKSSSKTTKLLAFLRFISVFGILLLLINPIIIRSSFETIKTPLPIVVDNSASITDLKAAATAKEIYEKLISNSDLNQKFDVQSYGFDSEFQSADEFNFKGKETKF
jgi:predicted PurR-regulated permease PerM